MQGIRLSWDRINTYFTFFLRELLYTGKLCIIGNGVVVDPEQLLTELKELQAPGKGSGPSAREPGRPRGFSLSQGFGRSGRSLRGKENAIGTTKRGIGPCYVDKYNRMGITMEI